LLAYYIGQLRFSQTDARYKGMTAKGFTFYAPQLLRVSPGLTLAILSVIAALYAGVNAFVMTRYRYHDNPWVDWLHSKKPIKQ
jgi:hypothetical protein